MTRPSPDRPRHAGAFLLSIRWVAAALLATCCLPPMAPAQESGPEARPFTGFVQIRQKDGTLSYEFTVVRGKVTSGTVAHGNRDDVKQDVVGGWYDRSRLVLLIQSRGENIRDPWYSHSHHFRKTGDGFTLEHTLFGYGQTMESKIVYPYHVIDRLVEVP